MDGGWRGWQKGACMQVPVLCALVGRVFRRWRGTVFCRAGHASLLANLAADCQHHATDPAPARYRYMRKSLGAGKSGVSSQLEVGRSHWPQLRQGMCLSCRRPGSSVICCDESPAAISSCQSVSQCCNLQVPVPVNTRTCVAT